MSDENQSPPTKYPPAAAAVVVNPPVLTFFPWAVHLPPGIRDEIVAEIEAFTPKSACPAHLEIAKTAAKAMIAALPESARGAEVRMECVGGDGKQILIQVTPKLVKKI